MRPNEMAAKTLLVGSPSMLGHSVSLPALETAVNPAEAIARLRRQSFEQIWVSLDSLPIPPETALRGLRQAAAQRPIILLATMHQEPFVSEWRQSSRLRRLFDDYWICPLVLLEKTHQPAVCAATQQTDAEIAQKDRRIAELEKLVVQDDLTGLKNRRYLRYFLPQVLQLASKHHLQVTLLIFDIDNFKHYNDTYGHSIGDRVLQQAGKLFERCCRSNDVVARLGGDEFAVVFWDLPHDPSGDPTKKQDRRNAKLEHPHDPLFMIDRFCRQLKEASFDMLGPKGKGALTISGGLATFPKDAKSAEELFEKADRAMLEAKKSGKNRIYLVGTPQQNQR